MDSQWQRPATLNKYRGKDETCVPGNLQEAQKSLG